MGCTANSAANLLEVSEDNKNTWGKSQNGVCRMGTCRYFAGTGYTL